MRVITVQEYGPSSYVYADGTWTGLRVSNECANDLNSVFALDLESELVLVCQEHGLTQEEAKVAINLMKE